MFDQTIYKNSHHFDVKTEESPQNTIHKKQSTKTDFNLQKAIYKFSLFVYTNFVCHKFQAVFHKFSFFFVCLYMFHCIFKARARGRPHPHVPGQSYTFGSSERNDKKHVSSNYFSFKLY